MKRILQYHLWKQKSGLLLLDMPTGSGKTFDVVDWIAQNIDTLSSKKRKILFITHRKKNLPVEQLKSLLECYHKSSYFDENCLVVQSKQDAFFEHFLEYEHQIKCCFPKFDSSSFRILLEFCKTHHLPSNKIERDVQEIASELRNLICDHLKTISSNRDDLLDLIVKDPNWIWVSKLFPSILTLKKTVLFMSVKKAVYPYDTLIEPIQPLHQLLSDYQVVLFIDEFDAAKRDMLEAIIDQNIDNVTEYIPIVQRIASRLNESKFPSTLIFNRQLLVKQPSSQEIEKNLTEQSFEISKKFSLTLSLKSKEQKSSFKPFIFYDKTPYYLIDAKWNILTLSKDIQNNSLWIEMSKLNKEGDSLVLSNLLFRSRAFLTYFERGIGMLAQEYLAHRNQISQDRKITLEDAIYSFLDFFDFDKKIEQKLLKDILHYYCYRKLKKQHSEKENSKIELPMSVDFYENGFVYHTILDSEEHAGRSKVVSFNFNQSPEIQLLNWAEQFMVVGISATANLRTCLGNFDLGYLESVLSSNYYHLTPNDKKRLEKRLQNQTQGYNKVSISAEVIESQSDNESMIIENLSLLFHDTDIVECLINKVQQVEGDNYSIYQLNQYYKIFLCYQHFLQKNIYAFLAFFNRKYVGEALTLIINFCKILEEKYRLSECIEIKCVSGEESEKQLDLIKESLNQGRRHFVLSTYSTLGAGINIQYPIPSQQKSHLIKINQWNADKCVDFDGLYLDKPTNVLVNMVNKKDLTPFELAIYLYQLEYLRITNSGMSKFEFEYYLENAFAIYSQRNPRYNHDIKSLYKYLDFKLNIMQYLIQAVGRICRTNMKRPQIYLFIDQHLDAVWSNELGEIPLLPEFKAIQKTMQKYQKLAVDKNRITGQPKRYIDYLYRKFSNQSASENDIYLWRQLREICLKYPQKNTHSDHNFNFLYITFDKSVKSYCYQTEDDYQNVYLTKSGLKVSHAASRLDLLMKIPLLKQHFIKNNYPFMLDSSKVWLSPVVFNNIYKGALGEECGKVLWESYCLPPLNELPLSIYEFFDFQISSYIFVDFKHWSDVKLDGENIREHIFNKMKICGAKLVFIINVFSEKNYYPFRCYSHSKLPLTIVEIPTFFSLSSIQIKNIIQCIEQKIMETENAN